MGLPYQQRYEDIREALRASMDGRQSDMWTALPGIVQSFNAEAITVTVQPGIQVTYTGANQQQQLINLPILQDVPVVFPRGGGYTLTFPVKPDDECLVVFSSRCIDNWWSKGGVQSQYELRMHDLSDGFALVGPFSQPNVIQNISTTTTQLRTNDGTIYIEIDDPNQTINVVAPTVNFNASTVVNANTPLVNASGEIIALKDIIAGGPNGVSLLNHVHINAGGAGDSGPPLVGS